MIIDNTPQSGEGRSFAWKGNHMPLTKVELIAARNFLRQARRQVGATRALFLGVGDHDTAARLNDIAVRLEDEIQALAKAKP